MQHRFWKKRLGWLAGLLCFISIPLALAQLFSPGKLSKAHKHLEGMGNCKKCHQGSRDVDSKRCLDCHKLLNKRIKKKRGYHGRMSPKKLKKCESCHVEHKGRNFAVVYWPGGMKKFKHWQTGYWLRFKHRIDCRKCHQPRFMKDLEVKSHHRRWNSLRKTFMGLSNTCQSCHKDPHEGQVSNNCEKCHTEKGFRPAHKFDHNKTRFVLRNKHAKVPCVDCHKPLPSRKKGALRFKVSTSCNSSGCHKDPHAGKMTTNCKRCHSDMGWKPISFALASHAPDRFPLTGAHRGQTCAACHGKDQKKPVRSACISCHKTPHPPSFSKRCQSCHNTTSWLKTKFSREQHQRTRFPLKGKHYKVACGKCHTPELKAAAVKAKLSSRFKMLESRFQNCTPCHKDVHGGQFKNRKEGSLCTSCHNEEHFKPSLFGVKAHSKSRFPLKGAHLATPCEACHKKPTQTANAVVSYRFNDRTCQGCHKDPHKGQYDSVIKKKGCEGCHNDKDWAQIHDFQHDLTKFALTGKHKQLDCKKCHMLKRRSNGRVLPLYKPRPKDCAGCHKDVHYGQFNKNGKKAQCQTCHTTKTWAKAKLFSHNNARFKLTGKHEKVACEKCHSRRKLPNQEEVTLYRPIAHKRCVDCHKNYHERGRK